MARKITYQELQDKIKNPELSPTELAELAPYFIIDEAKSTAFQPVTTINWELVERPIAKNSGGGSFLIGRGNEVDSFYRRSLFSTRCLLQPERLIFLSEGDSWFQFPVVLKDVIDYLIDDQGDFKGYNICSLDAAGDTTKNMVFSRPEVMDELRRLYQENLAVAGLLFSGGGNDILGDDDKGKPVFHRILQHNLAQPTIDNVFQEDQVKLLFKQIRIAYEKLFTDVHSEFPELPIFIHSYDYVYPGAFSDEDRRKPHWVGKAMADIGIVDKLLQKEITTRLLNQLYAIQQALVAEYPNVHLIETLGTLQNVSDWNDEIHPTNQGFGQIAQKFIAKIEQVIGSSN
jgi:hypothetical protein